jgi:hypothetical protein
MDLRHTYRNNLVCQNTHNWTLKNRLTHHGTVTAPPQFISYARADKPDLRLHLTSPAIGKGNATFALPCDFDGRPRNPGHRSRHRRLPALSKREARVERPDR